MKKTLLVWNSCQKNPSFSFLIDIARCTLQILNICSDAGGSPRISHRSIYGLTIFKLIENGLGVSIVPISLNYRIKFIELIVVIQKTELFAVWNRANRADELFHFIEQLDHDRLIRCQDAGYFSSLDI